MSPIPESSPIVVDDALSAARAVAAQLIETIELGATRVGLATGATFDAVYDEIARRQPDWEHVEFVLLDEYVGLAPDDKRSFRNTLLRDVFEPLGLRTLQLKDPGTTDPVDLQLLGIGRNGHIAFNEPGSSFTSSTRVVPLSKETRRANAASFGDDLAAVPTHAITRGIGTILAARRIVLLATGEAKAYALAQSLEIEPSEAMPASALQTHPNALVIADRAAAKLLTN